MQQLRKELEATEEDGQRDYLRHKIKKLNKEAAKSKILSIKQDRLLFVALHVLINLAEVFYQRNADIEISFTRPI